MRLRIRVFTCLFCNGVSLPSGVRGGWLGQPAYVSHQISQQPSLCIPLSGHTEPLVPKHTPRFLPSACVYVAPLHLGLQKPYAPKGPFQKSLLSEAISDFPKLISFPFLNQMIYLLMCVFLFSWLLSISPTRM